MPKYSFKFEYSTTERVSIEEALTRALANPVNLAFIIVPIRGDNLTYKGHPCKVVEFVNLDAVKISQAGVITVVKAEELS